MSERSFAGESPDSAHEQVIAVDAQSPYDVSGRDDIRLMQSYFQGASWDKPISSDTWKKLQPLGMTRVRLINVESREAVKIEGASKRMRFDFSLMQPGLQDCRAYSLVPHIIVGQNPQSALMTKLEGNKLGVMDWQTYAEYAYALLKFVAVEQGFIRADFEVSNEPDTNGASWLLSEKRPFGHPDMYAAYVKLYQVWSDAVQRLSHEHPELRIRIGGPAAGPYTFSAGASNWYGWFAKDVAQKKLRLDFCSFHFYGNEAPLSGLPPFGLYGDFSGLIGRIRSALADAGLGNVPVYVTEWGASYYVNDPIKGIINGNHVGASWAARFVMNMAEAKVDSALLLVMRDHRVSPGSTENNWAWPSLLLSDGMTEKALYNVATMFVSMPGRRVATAGGEGALKVVASANKNKVAVMLTNHDWDYSRAVERAKPETIRIRIKGLPFRAARVRVARSTIDGAHGNVYATKLAGREVNSGNAELAREEYVADVRGGMVELSRLIVAPSSVSLWEVAPMR